MQRCGLESQDFDSSQTFDIHKKREKKDSISSPIPIKSTHCLYQVLVNLDLFRTQNTKTSKLLVTCELVCVFIRNKDTNVYTDVPSSVHFSVLRPDVHLFWHLIVHI